MTDLLYTTITFLLAYIDIYFFYRILSSRLIYRFPEHTHVFAYVLSTLIYPIGIAITDNIPGTPFHGPLLLSFLFILFFLYKDSFLKRIFWIASSFLAIVVFEFLAIPITMLITKTPFSEVSVTLLSQTLGSIIARVSLLIFLFLFLKQKKNINTDFQNNFSIIIITASTYIFIMINSFYFNRVSLKTEHAITLSCIAMFLIAFLSVFLLTKIRKKSDEITNTSILLHQAEMELKQNENIANLVDELRSLRHDMNNHMSILNGLLTMKEYDDAIAYLSTITNQLNVANDYIFLDNKVLSVLINSKATEASENNITFHTEILTSTTPFSDGELCVVLGNILENAIEASSNHTNPYIVFSMKKENNQLLIQCDNTYTVAPIFQNGQLVTTKSDKAYHGIGTRNIRSIVENYHGKVSFMVDELFHVNISIPI